MAEEKKPRSTRKKVAKDLVAGSKLPVDQLRAQVKDILGVTPKEITVEFEGKLGPGGTRAASGDGDWDANIHKYRY